MLGTILLLNGVGDAETFRPDFAGSIVMDIPLFLAGALALFLLLRKNNVSPADSE